MKICPKCRNPLPDNGRFCPSCGVDQTSVPVADLDATIAVPTAKPADPSLDVTVPPPLTHNSVLSSSPSFSSPPERFIPGAIIGERYRIVGLLGRGGMGEVYRADDLKLGQPVALKFLPPGLENDPDRLQRFLGEVRTARQVTHPNVCRVYDIDEVDGQHFLSMEYVDGEDLASLLLRIGRLPQERAVSVAREICAGLAAAHDRGILHRDLKPANIMIDGRGRVRLTDFGLASLIEDIPENEVNVGTPAYMAPEQIAGREVTVRSDIYALGLVLYEVFTGRRTFEADTVVEMRQMQTSAAPSSMTRHVSDLDPTVERAVQRCLEKEPADRPASVLAVSAALPGGDPLAAALAAGETPSPELVAEAGERQGLPVGRTILLAVVGLVLLFSGTHLAGNMTSTAYLSLDRKPEVYEDKARGILADLGYTEDAYTQPADRAWGFVTWYAMITEIVNADTTDTPFEALRRRPDAISYWYRQSTNQLLPVPSTTPIFLRGPVTLMDPPMARTGDVAIMLDGVGNLRRLEVMPTRFSTADTIVDADWAQLFALAGLDMDRFSEDRPRYQRYMAPDRRRAWTGTSAERPELLLQVEAGSYEGRSVLFNVATKTSLASLSTPPAVGQNSVGDFFLNSLQSILIILVVFVSAFVARRNYNQGRADRRGAARFGKFTFGIFVIATSLSSPTLFSWQWADEIWPILIGGLFVGASNWFMYAGIEPLGRQVWPTMFVASSRLLSRPDIQWRDPALGQSVLVGMIGGCVLFLFNVPFARMLIPLWDSTQLMPLNMAMSGILGQRYALSTILDQALLLAFVFIFVVSLVFTRKIIRRLPVALGVTLVIWTLINGVGDINTTVFSVVTSILMMTILLRWGVLTLVVSRIVYNLAWQGRAADLGAWHAQEAVLIHITFVVMAAYGIWAAIGNRQTES